MGERSDAHPEADADASRDRAAPPAGIAVRVEGRVQGVGFRAATQREAVRLGLVGWVRNRADGDVEAEFHGAPEALATIVAWCHDGPSWARVTRVETRPLRTDAQPPEGGFRIR